MTLSLSSRAFCAKPIAACLFFLYIWGCGGTFYVHGDSSLVHEVDRLKRQLLTLEQNFYQGKGQMRPPSPMEPTPSSTQGQTQAAMEQEIQRLTATLEDTRHIVKLQEKEIQALKNDIEMRLAQLEKKNAVQNQMKKTQDKDPKDKNPKDSAEVQASPSKKEAATDYSLVKPLTLPDKPAVPPVPSSPSSPTPSPTPHPLEASFAEQTTALSSSQDQAGEEYNASLALLKGKEYKAAQKAFDSFIKNHPDHALTGNAQFWLGETYAALEDYTQASVAFLSAYKNYPDNSKRPESLLKLAHCLGHLGKQKEACATLQKLSADFPQGSSALKRMAAEEQKRNGCL